MPISPVNAMEASLCFHPNPTTRPPLAFGTASPNKLLRPINHTVTLHRPVVSFSHGHMQGSVLPYMVQPTSCILQKLPMPRKNYAKSISPYSTSHGSHRQLTIHAQTNDDPPEVPPDMNLSALQKFFNVGIGYTPMEGEGPPAGYTDINKIQKKAWERATSKDRSSALKYLKEELTKLEEEKSKPDIEAMLEIENLIVAISLYTGECLSANCEQNRLPYSYNRECIEKLMDLKFLRELIEERFTREEGDEIIVGHFGRGTAGAPFKMSDARPHLYLAFLYALLNERKEAKYWWERFIEVDY